MLLYVVDMVIGFTVVASVVEFVVVVDVALVVGEAVVSAVMVGVPVASEDEDEEVEVGIVGEEDQFL